MHRGVILLLLLSLTMVACSDPSTQEAAPAPVARGRKVYVSYCTACHHDRPTRPGTLGPAIAGASRELLEAKVLRGTYPPGYTPKRTSRAMPAFPHLRDDIPDLAAYLQAAASP